MSRQKDRRLSFTGISMLLTAFSVLCLTVFALLSLTTVLAEKRIAEASVRSVTEYYQADLQAQEIFARLCRGETVAGVEETGNILRYACPVSGHQRLEVELERSAKEWKIRRWQVVADPEMDPQSQALPVWQGPEEGAES